MTIEFTKMHGAGNDFVVIDNLDGRLDLTTEQIAYLCDRRFGVGADGLLLLEKGPTEELDAQMVYYNADGSRADMCGNGARCFTSFALAHQLGLDGRLKFRTDAGDMEGIAEDGSISVQMTPARDTQLSQRINLQAGPATVHYTDTGVPHVVKFVDDIQAVDIKAEGAELRFHDAFQPRGANANFVQIKDDLVWVRTYERGVEDETLACGTGVTAAAILSHLVHQVEKPVSLRVSGGDTLKVDFRIEDDTIDQVTLTGPAKAVYTGTVEI
ncbi:MAG: diaminopimelate epimerase [Verrucomicrobia bacterium]|nr:diaminopimelate epimerase [Verrucomicrobiota bacterium]